MAEAGVRGAQHALAQHRGMGVHQRERGVVADRADIAEVVGDALQFRHQGAQPDAARGRLDAKRAFHRPHESDRIGDGAVAGGAGGEQRGALERSARHQRVDPFVDIAEPFLEPDDRLAARRESKMSGLDDSRVHRTDRNLMQPLALGGQESIGRHGGGGPLPPQRRGNRPASVIEPRPRIGRANRDEAE